MRQRAHEGAEALRRCSGQAVRANQAILCGHAHLWPGSDHSFGGGEEGPQCKLTIGIFRSYLSYHMLVF